MCLSGLTAVTAPALAELLLRCPRIVRFKAELWYDGESNPPPHASSRTGSAAPALQPLPANAPENGRRSFRMLGSVRGTVRYLKSVLPASDPSIGTLVAVRASPLSPCRPPLSPHASLLTAALPAGSLALVGAARRCCGGSGRGRGGSRGSGGGSGNVWHIPVARCARRLCG